MTLLSPRPGDFVFETTSTAGTFNTFALSGTRVSDPTTGFTYDLFADYFADGELVYYVRTQTTLPGVRAVREEAIGIYHKGPNTIEPTIGLWSTNMAAGSATWVPITWAAGSQNVTCGIPGRESVAVSVMAQVLALAAAANRTALGLGTAATFDVGTTANHILKLDGSAKIPAVDGSQITGLPSTPIPAGSKLAFYQAAAPSGWTLITTLDDTVMFITNGSGITGGGPHAGGTSAANTWDPTPTFTVGNHALTRAELPIVTSGASGSAVDVISAISPAGGHSHGITSSGGWRPPAAYFILCSKN
jgi:hypothetical protein